MEKNPLHKQILLKNVGHCVDGDDSSVVPVLKDRFVHKAFLQFEYYIKKN